MLAYASLLIAFLATAGAIPVCRAMAVKFGKADATQASLGMPKVAGEGMLCGVFIAMFYLHPYLVGPVLPLLGGVTLAVAMTWVYRKFFGAFTEGYYRRVFAASLLAAAAVLLPEIPLHLSRSPVDMALTGMALLTPLAICSLGRSGPTTPALPAGIVLAQLVLLLIVDFALGPGSTIPAAGIAFPAVALPVIGALAAALVYLSPARWRAAPVITAGTGTRLCLGLVVAWGVLAVRSSHGEAGSAALIWILVVPLFELLRRLATLAMRRARRLTDASSASDHPARLPLAPASARTFAFPPFAVLVATLASGATAIVLAQVPVPAYLSLAAIPAVLLVYWFVPKSLHSPAKPEHARMVDVPR